jgi:hypothetical protein
VPGSPKNRTSGFHRIRLKQAVACPAARRRTIRSTRRGSSAGPFTTTMVEASNLSVGSGVIVVFSCWAHLIASARFRVRAPGPVSGQLSETTSGGASHRVPVSCCLSATGIRFSIILFPPRDWAFLTVGLPAPGGRTQTGLPRSTRTSHDRGGSPLYPEDDDAHPDLGDVPSRRLPLHGGSSFNPAPTSHLARLRLTRHQ